MKNRTLALTVVGLLALLVGTGNSRAASSTDQAVAEATAAGALSAGLATQTSVSCYTETATESFGTWPYEQDVHLHTTWCGTGPADQGGYITSWSSYATVTETACSSSNTYRVKMYGGVGSTYVAIEGGSYFDCIVAPPPFPHEHHHTWLQMKYGPGGGLFVLGGG